MVAENKILWGEGGKPKNGLIFHTGFLGNKTGNAQFLYGKHFIGGGWLPPIFFVGGGGVPPGPFPS